VTADDYALSPTEKAQRESRDLEQRIAALESCIATLMRLLLARGDITINDARECHGLAPLEFR
jgi:hypothetical protein